MTDHIEPVTPSNPVLPLLAIAKVELSLGLTERGPKLEKRMGPEREEDSIRNVCIRRAPPAALAPRWGMICHGVQVHPSH